MINPDFDTTSQLPIDNLMNHHRKSKLMTINAFADPTTPTKPTDFHNRTLMSNFHSSNRPISTAATAKRGGDTASHLLHRTLINAGSDYDNMARS